MTLAVDFDNTIHDVHNPVPGRRMGAPTKDAQKCMRELEDMGFKLIIHTVKATTPGGMKAVEDWLEYYDIPYHEVTAIKPNADFYIDDKAIRHIDWASTFRMVKYLAGIAE